MRFARWVFVLAGIYGLIVTIPLYFIEGRLGRQDPPPITHPEYYYGFAGLCLAWQVLFLLIGWDPGRLRPAIAVAILEKLSFAVAIPVLYHRGRVGQDILSAAIIDGVWALLFAIALLRMHRGRGDALLFDRR